MRVNAFALPIALFLLGFVALITTQIYYYQITMISNLDLANKRKNYQEGIRLIIQNSIIDTKISKKFVEYEVSKNRIFLDGLYNLSHLIELTALGGKKIKVDQVKKLEKILNGCELDPNLANIFAEKLLQAYASDISEKGIVSFITGFSLTPEERLSLLSCVRLRPMLEKINLKYSNKVTISQLFEIDISSAQKIISALRGGEINNLDELIIYFRDQFGLDLDRRDIENIEISNFSKNKGIYWTQNAKTFAYVDVSRDVDKPWSANWKLILWIPEEILWGE
jgi:hypothetical protein